MIWEGSVSGPPRARGRSGSLGVIAGRWRGTFSLSHKTPAELLDVSFLVHQIRVSIRQPD